MYYIISFLVYFLLVVAAAICQPNCGADLAFEIAVLTGENPGYPVVELLSCLEIG